MKKILLLRTLLKLGLWNVAYVAWYRLSLKSGIRKRWFPTSQLPTYEDFFKPVIARTDFPDEWKSMLLKDAVKIISGNLCYFSYHWKELGTPPQWFLNPFNGRAFENTNLHWTKLPDFNEEIGDIKNIWEASRFSWILTLARAYSISGNSKYLETLNLWLKDWTKNNPLNTGPNWKCGQEASIRVFNLVNTSHLLRQETKPTKELADLIYFHLERINGNILYSIAQDNNHGTSEAAALFIGGAYLLNSDPLSYPKAKYYARKGRRWLENRVKKLIEDDGSFSQHSVNYHRLMLDTLSFTEFWRKKLKQKEFSIQFYEKAKAAINWLYSLTDYTSGLAVNLGANDGALLNNLGSQNYRDFRPSLQMASALFLKTTLFDEGHWNETLWWLNEKGITTAKSIKPFSKVFASGYVRLNGTSSWALLRFPYFKFRPSHNDVFHFDLWYKGENVLCDAGSYSYNPPKEESNIDLKSVNHHNTISFDGQEQMPKLSRFLLGNWVKPKEIGEIINSSEGTVSWNGCYIDNYKNRHQRKIVVKSSEWIIEDTLSGNFSTAIIGFNLNTLSCELKGNQLNTSFGYFTLPENAACTITKTIISEYYFSKRIISRLNIEITKAGTYKTYIHLI